VITPSHLREDCEQVTAIARWLAEESFDPSRGVPLEKHQNVRAKYAKIDFIRKEGNLSRPVRYARFWRRRVPLETEMTATSPNQFSEPRLARAMSKLREMNAIQHSCIVLRFFDGLTFLDIAKKFRMSEPWAYLQIREALRNLRRFMLMTPELPVYPRLPDCYYQPSLTARQIDHIEREQWMGRSYNRKRIS
jgi:DNA-directed RNA polymerase specialized sigma24 family protein